MIKAPYNFVPLAKDVVFPEWADQISMDVPFEDGISGTITVKYTAQTPVFVGNGKKNNSSLVENFKAANGKYALPGSSIRGMLRNVIEIASFGKFCRIDDLTLSVRDLQNPNLYGKYLTIDKGGRTYEALAKAGWLVNESGGWVLYPVSYHRVEDDDLEAIYHLDRYTYEKRCEPQKRRLTLKKSPIVFFKLDNEKRHPHHGGMTLVYSKVSEISKVNFGGAKKGYTVLTGQPGRRENFKTHRKEGKHMDFIFEERTSKKILLDKKIIRAFQDANPPNAANQQKGYDINKELKDFQNNNYPGIPVFYLADSNGNPESLGLSQMYRLPYKNTLMKAVLHSSELHGEEFKMDLPECIFGKIDNNKTSLRGRVQFEDAVGKNVSLDSMITTILGNPKPSFYPNYIEQNPQKGDYTTLMDANVKLRGWKRYPVHNKLNPIDANNVPDNQRSQFTPLKKDSVFEGKIHFHNLKHQELGALLWAITWDNKKELSHSIGMGKPYGFGQIKAEIKSLSFLENSTISNDYAEANVEKISSWQNDFSTYMESQISNWKDSQQLKELFAMANPNNAKRPNWNLDHMKLDSFFNGKKTNDFVDAKKAKEYLAPYSSDRQNLSLGGGCGNNYSSNMRNNGGRNIYQGTTFQTSQPKFGNDGVGTIQICILLEEKTKKGGWKAKLKNDEEIRGVIQNSQQVPADKMPGDEIKLKLKSKKGNDSSFEYVK